MEFGAERGQIEIILPSTSFSPGQTIEGIVRMALHKPTVANHLRVEFFGIPKPQTNLSQGKILEMSQTLSGNRTYMNGEEFDFCISIPRRASDLSGSNSTGGIFQDEGDSVLGLAGIDWYVAATLESGSNETIAQKASIQILLP